MATPRSKMPAVRKPPTSSVGGKTPFKQEIKQRVSPSSAGSSMRDPSSSTGVRNLGMEKMPQIRNASSSQGSSGPLKDLMYRTPGKTFMPGNPNGPSMSNSTPLPRKDPRSAGGQGQSGRPGAKSTGSAKDNAVLAERMRNASGMSSSKLKAAPIPRDKSASQSKDKSTGRANALTRGQGKKVGLKRITSESTGSKASQAVKKTKRPRRKNHASQIRAALNK